MIIKTVDTSKVSKKAFLIKTFFDINFYSFEKTNSMKKKTTDKGVYKINIRNGTFMVRLIIRYLYLLFFIIYLCNINCLADKDSD